MHLIQSFLPAGNSVIQCAELMLNLIELKEISYKCPYYMTLKRIVCMYVYIYIYVLYIYIYIYISDYKVYVYIVKQNYILGGILFIIRKAQLHVSALNVDHLQVVR